MRRKLSEFKPLLGGEQLLLAGLGSGELVVLEDGAVPPDDAGDARQVRGEFIRYLLLGGCNGLPNPVHEKGVRLKGGLITGVLDLEGCRIARNIVLFNCRFEKTPVLRSAKIDNLFLDGSNFPGLDADQLQARGCVFLRRVKSRGEIRLLGADLGGNLECDGAKLQAAGTDSALCADGAKVSGTFFWRKGARAKGLLDLTNAEFGNICDEQDCWPDHRNLALDRCRYGAFTGGPVTAKARIDWLSRQDPSRFKQDFRSQPWEQCAKVLRKMGYRADAKAVLIDKEKRQRADRRAQLKREHMYEDYYVHSILDPILGLTVRYGHQPLLAFAWLFGLLLIGSLVFGIAEKYDAIKPNDVRIMRAVEWTENMDKPDRIVHFHSHIRAQSYPRFNPFIYSADTLFPVVSLEMQSFWIPDENHGIFGRFARVYLWFHIAMGWFLSLVAVAGFSGLIRSD